MRMTEAFLTFSLTFTVIVFLIFRTPFILYMGLLYSLVFFMEIERIGKRVLKLDVQSLIGILLILISPVFLVVRIGGYTSPSTFHALLLAGTSLILFNAKGTLVPLGVLALDVLTALTAKTVAFKEAVSWLSARFVDMTSYIVEGLIRTSGVPISINGNVAVVRNSMIIIRVGCSGLDAFTLYILASFLLIYLRKSDRRETILLLIGALGIIPLNAVRIFSLLVIGYHSGISFLELFHSHLGDLMFLAYVFTYWWWVTGRKKKMSAAPEHKN